MMNEGGKLTGKLWYIITTVCGSLMIIFSIMLFVAAIYPFKVIDVHSPLKVLSPIVNQGDCVFVEMVYNKYIDQPSIISAQIVTEQNVIITSQMLSCNLEPGKNTVVIGFQLPRNINLISKSNHITASMKITERYEVMGFKNIDTTYNTEMFKIRIKPE